MIRLSFLSLPFLLFFGSRAQATLTSSLTSPTLEPMPALGISGTAGPISFSNITWTSSDGNGYFGIAAWGFGSNGDWDGGEYPFTAENNLLGSMTFAFSTPVEGVLGFINYLPPGVPTTIAVYDSANVLIESYALTFTTGGASDSGEFLGFVEPTADIAYFTLSNGYIGVTDLEEQLAPEPGTLFLLGGALTLLAIARRKHLCARGCSPSADSLHPPR
jgi:hypothetical protein